MFRCSRVTLDTDRESVRITEWPFIVLEVGEPNDPVVLNELFGWDDDVQIYRLVDLQRVLSWEEQKRHMPSGRKISRKYVAVRQHDQFDTDLANGDTPLCGFTSMLLVPSQTAQGGKDEYPHDADIMIYEATHVGAWAAEEISGVSGPAGHVPANLISNKPNRARVPKAGMMDRMRYGQPYKIPSWRTKQHGKH